MKVTLVAKTQGVGPLASRDGGEVVSYCARVSNPDNQLKFDSYTNLLKYCMKHGHVSVFEMADYTFEIVTSRAIAAQILRHRSFHFQEFSQRYAKAQQYEKVEARLQDPKNKQNSLPVEDAEVEEFFEAAQKEMLFFADSLYHQALDKGIAKEQARFLLPMSVQTTMYMKGTLRSWIHYLAIRRGKETQKEHREIAEAIYQLLMLEIPEVMSLLPEYDIISNNPYD